MLGYQHRRLLAILLALGSGSGFAFISLTAGEDTSPTLAIMGLLCILGGIALQARGAGWQIFARGAIWSSAVFQLLVVHILSFDRLHGIGLIGLVAIGGCIVAACLSLLLAGRPVHHSSSQFQPVAHLGTLTVALVLAMADTISLIFWGSLAAQGGAMDTAFGLLGGGALMGIGVYGLLRLRTWALLLNLFSNILIASVVAMELIDVGPLALVLITTAALQLLVATPILALILRPGLRAPSWMQALGQKLPTASLLVTAALAVQPLLGESVLVRIVVWAGY